MFCTKCGREIPDGNDRCPYCGENVEPHIRIEREIKEMASEATEVVAAVEKQIDQAASEMDETLRASFNDATDGRYASSPPAFPRRLEDDRSLIVYILLNFVTCGIYSYFFVYRLARDINIACEGDGSSTPGLLAFVLLSIVTCGFYSLYWEYRLGNRLQYNAPRYGLNFTENGTTVLLWHIFGFFLCFLGPFIAMNILIVNSNDICAAYNHMNFGMR